VETCAALGSPPTAGDHHADYQKVDSLLDAEEESVRQSFENAAELAADRHLSAVASLVANWSINDARDVAWGACRLHAVVRAGTRRRAEEDYRSARRPAAGLHNASGRGRGGPL
jgi:hypothetical protein